MQMNRDEGKVSWGLFAALVASIVILFRCYVIDKYPIYRWNSPQWIAMIGIILAFVIVGIYGSLRNEGCDANK